MSLHGLKWFVWWYLKEQCCECLKNGQVKRYEADDTVQHRLNVAMSTLEKKILPSLSQYYWLCRNLGRCMCCTLFEVYLPLTDPILNKSTDRKSPELVSTFSLLYWLKLKLEFSPLYNKQWTKQKLCRLWRRQGPLNEFSKSRNLAAKDRTFREVVRPLQLYRLHTSKDVTFILC